MHQSHEYKIDKTDFTLFFSLPFYPRKFKNFFYNGHMALGIGRYVYQIYNPKLLKSDFMVSIMPIKNWLFKEKVKWVDKNRNSNTYKYVNLYGKSEIKRTIVYAVKINKFLENCKNTFKSYFIDLETKYQNGKINFTLLKNNCATLLFPILKEMKILPANFFSFLPSKVFITAINRSRMLFNKLEIIKINNSFEKEFNLHRFCFGIPSLNPEKHMDQILEKFKLRNTTQLFNIIKT